MFVYLKNTIPDVKAVLNYCATKLDLMVLLRDPEVVEVL